MMHDSKYWRSRDLLVSVSAYVVCVGVYRRLSCQSDGVVRGAFDARRTGIVLNECVAQMGESRVIEER